MTYSVIMAGGVGSRFWPLSRRRMPKHLLTLFNSSPLICETLDRILPFTPVENILVVTNGQQYPLIKKNLPGLESSNFLIEPVGRNTAPCIGLAAIHIRKIDPTAMMIVLPADHLIDNVEEFHYCIHKAVEIAREEQCLMTIGIPPTRPETGYGYIQRNSDCSGDPLVGTVKTFAEKPNLATAERFITSGDFYWNSGIFVWRTDVILHQIEEYLPELYQSLCEIEKYIDDSSAQKRLRRIYRRIHNISIDYGVMERAENVKVIEGRFGWSDVGSWDEAYRRTPKDRNGNAAIGEHLFIDSQNCYVNSPKKFVAVVGLDNVIVVESSNALLVCRRQKAQDVKQVVEKLERMKAWRLF